VRVLLTDGRVIETPQVWYGALVGQPTGDLDEYELIEGGRGIFWPTLDEAISVAGLLGVPD